ncbi:multidrug effflux MFS transporter [uncultured Shewanella sp.]|uniref:multidrug effflux MFS transporter n=1 Tax=uncultured Shewanella sp. TaxID=173975 RepID=UPI00261235FE|nr:multidrug effflux MFS transporter [uncultured Shewanella sp.]
MIFNAKLPNNMLGVGLVLAPMVGIITLSLDIYAPSLPNMMRMLSSSQVESQLTMTAYTLSMGVGQLIFGPLSDRFGRRMSAISALLVYILGSLYCIVSSSVESLIIARVIQGLAASAAVVTAYAIIRDRYVGVVAAKGYGFLSSAATLGTLVGPVVGSLLQDQFHSFRAAFIVLFIFGIVALLIAVIFVEDTSRFQPRQPLNFRQVFKNYSLIIRNKSLLGYSVFSTASTILFFTLTSISPFILIEQYHVSQQAYGFYFASCALMFAMGAFCSTRWVELLGLNRSIILGASLMLIGALLMLLSNLYIAKNAVTFILPAWLLFWGVAFCFGPSLAAAMEDFKAMGGAASAVLACIRYGLGSLLGTFFMSQFANTAVNFSLFFIVISIGLLGGILNQFRRDKSSVK